MAQNSNALVTKQKSTDLRKLFDSSKDAIASIMPTYIKPDRILRLGLSAIMRDPKLLECDAKSILLAIMNASVCGVEPNTPMQEGYLIPRKNNKVSPPRMEAGFMPSYRGLLKLVRNSGQVASVQAHIVYSQEEFSLDYGANPPIKHVPILDGDPGEPRLVYAIAKMTDPNADPIVQVLTMKDIAKIKSCSQAGTGADTPWGKWPDQMMIKSAIRRICKYLPASAEMATVVAMDDRATAGETQVDLAPPEMLAVLGIEDDTPPEGETVDPVTGEISMGELQPGDASTHQGYEKPSPALVSADSKPKDRLF